VGDYPGFVYREALTRDIREYCRLDARGEELCGCVILYLWPGARPYPESGEDNNPQNPLDAAQRALSGSLQNNICITGKERAGPSQKVACFEFMHPL
jgi:hypothetical protein